MSIRDVGDWFHLHSLFYFKFSYCALSDDLEVILILSSYWFVVFCYDSWYISRDHCQGFMFRSILIALIHDDEVSLVL